MRVRIWVIGSALGKSDCQTSQAEIAQDNARGETLFERYGCAGCHVPERAEKGVVAKPLAGLARRYTVPSLEAFLAAPTPPMPVFPLSESDRHALAVHLLATRP